MKKFLKIGLLLAAAWALNVASPEILKNLPSGMEAFWVITVMLGFGWVCAEFAKGTFIPSFTLQLIVGIVLHDALSPLTPEVAMIVTICNLLAAIVLKSGGDEVERRLFGKIALPTILIATVGYLITFFVMVIILLLIGLDGKTAALLSAIIGSTDPAALIPSLKKVYFKDEYEKLVAISIAESAINDAIGAVFTTAVVLMVKNGTDVSTLMGISSGVADVHNAYHIGKELLFGVIAGVFGWGIMYWYEKHKSTNHETSYDFAVVLAVPIFVYLLAVCIGGNGFLAAFITGLLADYNHGNHGFKRTLEAMEVKIDSIAKPVIFMMAGPLISISDLMDTALLGFVVSMLFMFVARPLAVLGSLFATNLSKKEKLFLCAVRETGVIPIALAVGVVSQFPELKQIMPLTAWVVIWTLTVLPAITPWWAKKLDLVKNTSDDFKLTPA